jgi:hypothetical protein
MECLWVLLYTLVDVLNSTLQGWLFADFYWCYVIMAVSLGMLKWGLSDHQGKEMDFFFMRREWLPICNIAPHSVLINEICKFHRVIGFLV